MSGFGSGSGTATGEVGKDGGAATDVAAAEGWDPGDGLAVTVFWGGPGRKKENAAKSNKTARPAPAPHAHLFVRGTSKLASTSPAVCVNVVFGGKPLPGPGTKSAIESGVRMVGWAHGDIAAPEVAAASRASAKFVTLG